MGVLVGSLTLLLMLQRQASKKLLALGSQFCSVSS
jgi:hypothetical protein